MHGGVAGGVVTRDCRPLFAGLRARGTLGSPGAASFFPAAGSTVSYSFPVTRSATCASLKTPPHNGVAFEHYIDPVNSGTSVFDFFATIYKYTNRLLQCMRSTSKPVRSRYAPKVNRTILAPINQSFGPPGFPGRESDAAAVLLPG